MATTVCEFTKIFQGSMPPDLPRAFFILKICQNLVPPPWKISEYAADMKNIF